MLDHQAQHVSLAGLGALRVLQRVIGRGRLRQASQQRRLGQGQIFGRLVEIELRGRLDAVGQVAVVDLVEVDLQNGVLGIAACDLSRQDGLFDLAGDAALWRQEDQLGQLLADGAGADHRPLGLHGAEDGAAEGDRIDPAVLVEVGVFGGDHGVDQVGRDFAERHAAAQAGGGIVGRQRRLQEAAIARIDARVLAVRGQRRPVGRLAAGRGPPLRSPA